MEITVPSELSRLVIQQSTQPDSLETISAEKASPLIMSTGDLASTSAIGVTNLVLTDYAKSTEENLCVRAHPPVTQSRSYDLATSSTPHIRTHKSGRGSMLSHTESSPPSFVSDATRLEPNSRAMDGGPLDQITHPPSLLPPCLLTGDDGVETPIIHALTTGSKPSSSFSS